MEKTDALALIKARTFPTMFTSLKIFPAVQVLVFRVLPTDMWLPALSLTGYLLGVYLNIMTALRAKAKAK